jgi:hypothetical protein
MEETTTREYTYVMLTSSIICVAGIIYVICTVLVKPSNLAGANEDEQKKVPC